MKPILKKTFKILAYILLAPIVLYLVVYAILAVFIHPSMERDWSPDQAVLATAIFEEGDKVLVKNIRNINYRTTTDYDVSYYDKEFDLSKIDSVWFMVEPFKGHGAGAAHTLISFGFENGNHVAVSAEIRKEKGESFGVVKGLLRQYELVYVIADERDVIKLRSNYRGDDVYLYKTNVGKEKARELFVSMLTRANKLQRDPEFYNTITNTCTTNIVSHVNELVPGKVPFSFKVLMPAYSDELAYNLGLIGNGESLEALREKYKINREALLYADDPDFSNKIREGREE